MKKTSPNSTSLTRRSFLAKTSKGLTFAALATGLPTGWVGGVYASDAPEISSMTMGFIALTDCAPIVIAHEQGLFKKYGIASKVTKPAGWGPVRDALTLGSIQATHMLLGMPIASTMGLGGGAVKPMVAPWILSRNGQGITLKNTFKGKVKADPKALKPLVDEAKKSGKMMQFAQTFPSGTHAMWLRYYLAAGGINPDTDVNLITIPPPQMVQNMKSGKMDGYCVGEPWNKRASDEGIGFTSIASQAIWKDHPEKVFAFTEEFAEKNPKAVKACLKALHEASIWLDDMNNRSEACDILTQPSYINCPKEIILERMLGIYDYGDGRKEKDPNYMIFHERNCNYPQAAYAKWFLSQYQRWGMTTCTPDYAGISSKVMRGDLYEAAMKEVGYSHGGVESKSITLFDGQTFDPANPEAFAKGAAVHSLKG